MILAANIYAGMKQMIPNWISHNIRMPHDMNQSQSTYFLEDM